MTTRNLHQRARGHFARKMESMLRVDDTSLTQLAARSRIHRVQLSRYLHAKCLPLLNNGATIARALGTTIQYLYGPYVHVVLRQPPRGTTNATATQPHRRTAGRKTRVRKTRIMHRTPHP